MPYCLNALLPIFIIFVPSNEKQFRYRSITSQDHVLLYVYFPVGKTELL